MYCSQALKLFLSSEISSLAHAYEMMKPNVVGIAGRKPKRIRDHILWAQPGRPTSRSPRLRSPSSTADAFEALHRCEADTDQPHSSWRADSQAHGVARSRSYPMLQNYFRRLSEQHGSGGPVRGDSLRKWPASRGSGPRQLASY